VVQDDTALNPQSSYGVQKAIGELLLSDYSRRGFVDGRVLRLPTISVRPGKPNAAASSFASGIIREPLSGVAANCPVAPETPLWLLAARRDPGAGQRHRTRWRALRQSSGGESAGTVGHGGTDGGSTAARGR
jgi:hypothetical protein